MKLNEAIEVLKERSAWIKQHFEESTHAEAIDTVVAHLTSENKRDLDDSLRDKAVEQPENKDNTSHKLDKKYETYRPFWEEMKEEILSRDPYPSPEFVSELQSILNRAYMNALEVGFNEGCKFSLDQKEKDMEAFAEFVSKKYSIEPEFSSPEIIIWYESGTFPTKKVYTTAQLRKKWEATRDKSLPDFELQFCNTCLQMTNHLAGKCQKCK